MFKNISPCPARTTEIPLLGSDLQRSSQSSWERINLIASMIKSLCNRAPDKEGGWMSGDSRGNGLEDEGTGMLRKRWVSPERQLQTSMIFPKEH